MNRSTAEVYTETGKKELGLRPAPKSHPRKRIDAEAKICKHLVTAGWCNKKHDRCPLMNLLFINQ
jgi:hypothetical protein